jgi:glycosyltransferase involved in cell wall biosynthesis
MRIGIEAQRLFRAKKHGMEVVALEAIRSLQKIDTQNEYVVFAKDDVDSKCIEETKNFKVVALPSKPYPVWEQYTLPKELKKHQLDLVHCTCNTAPLYLSKKLVLTLHDIIFLEQLSFKGTAYQNFGNIYRRFVVPKIVKKCETIITVSDFERENIIKTLNLPEEKVKTVYNAVHPRFNTNYTTDELVAFREKYKLPESYILFLGNTAPKKNTIGAIKAYIEYCRNTRDAKKMVVLDFSEDNLIKLLGELGASDLKSNFYLPGYVPSVEMPKLYNLAFVYLYPSFRESFGLPIVEAMASGCPLITSNTSSMPEIAAGAALLADPYKPEEIAEKLIQMCSDTPLRNDFAAKGIERAKYFSWDNTAKQYQEIYLSALR